MINNSYKHLKEQLKLFVYYSQPKVAACFKLIMPIYGTIVVSEGLTASLRPFGKIMIIIAMFIGRVRLLILVFALSSPMVSTNYKYPNTHMMIG